MSTVTERLNVEILNAVQFDMFETQNFLVRHALEAWAHVVHVGLHHEALKRARTAGSKEAAEILELARKKKILWKEFSKMAGCNMHQLIREAWVNDHIPKATIEKAEQIPIMNIHYAPVEGKTIK